MHVMCRALLLRALHPETLTVRALTLQTMNMLLGKTHMMLPDQAVKQSAVNIELKTSLQKQLSKL